MNDPSKKLLDRDFFLRNRPVQQIDIFTNARQACGRHKLEPGTYVIVPCTFEKNQTGEFLLRIFTENKQQSRYNQRVWILRCCILIRCCIFFGKISAYIKCFETCLINNWILFLSLFLTHAVNMHTNTYNILPAPTQTYTCYIHTNTEHSHTHTVYMLTCAHSVIVLT